MSSLASIVAADGPLQLKDEGLGVRSLQLALSAAGYRVDINQGEFTDDTQYWVQQFQRQHGLAVDGVVGPITAAALDGGHAMLVATAIPQSAVSELTEKWFAWPNDDTASLLAFYGRPWENPALIVQVPVPFAMTYENQPVKHIAFHVKGAQALTAALNKIAGIAKSNPSVLRHVSRYSGSGNYRTVRGSSRLSTHAFWAAIDFDVDRLPLGAVIPAVEMPQEVVDAFKEQGFFWGGDYRGRKDAMHFALAHE